MKANTFSSKKCLRKNTFFPQAMLLICAIYVFRKMLLCSPLLLCPSLLPSASFCSQPLNKKSISHKENGKASYLHQPEWRGSLSSLVSFYPLQAEVFRFPPITHLTGCTDKKLNSSKMLRCEGKDEAVGLIWSCCLWDKGMKM